MRKVVKYSVWTVGVILLLPLLVLFLLYLPPVQDLVKDKALASVSERTGMVLEAGTFRLGFPLKLDLEDVYVGKSPVDTLVALQSLHLKVGLRDILKLRAQVDELLVEQVKFALHNDSTGLDLKVDMGQVALAVRQVDLKTRKPPGGRHGDGEKEAGMGVCCGQDRNGQFGLPDEYGNDSFFVCGCDRWIFDDGECGFGDAIRKCGFLVYFGSMVQYGDGRASYPPGRGSCCCGYVRIRALDCKGAYGGYGQQRFQHGA